MSKAQYSSAVQPGLSGPTARKAAQMLPPPVPALPVGLPPAEPPPEPVGLPAAPALELGPLPVPAVHVTVSGHSSPTTTPAQPLGAMASGASKSTDQSAAQERCCVSFDD